MNPERSCGSGHISEFHAELTGNGYHCNPGNQQPQENSLIYPWYVS